MENKYYTPSIEEFHVGFEYEQEIEYGEYPDAYMEWINEIITTPKDISYVESILSSIISYKIRVKYLDKEDIESLGFTYYDDSNHLFQEQDRSFFYKEYSNNKDNNIDRIGIVKRGTWLLIYEYCSNKSYVDDVTRFCGNIKNKSELKVLLKQLGIE